MTFHSRSDAPLGPLPDQPPPDLVLDRFIAVMAERGLALYPEQEEAILELFADRNVILNTPTGSGKSLVAAAFHFKMLCAGERSIYTCPIKALVNEKFLALCRDFGPENVGMMTGDASVNPSAPILCCTAEILANLALAGGDRGDIRAVIMDEFHYYSDPERGVAWQVPLLTMPRSQFLLMSATLGSTAAIEKDLERVTGRTTLTVRSDRRPVPLAFEYSDTPLTERVAALVTEGRAPVYLVFFTQRAAAEAAQSLMSLNVSSREEKAALATALEEVRFTSPYGKDMRRWLRSGIGVHHAGLLPRYRILVEQLAQKGLLKLICGTDTLGVGINVPIRTVLFTQLWKYDGRKAAVLTVRDFRQVAGRAGRKGFDDQGYVVVQAPEHVIENKRAEEKAANDPKKKRKLVKRRPPDGSVSWDSKTLEKLQTAEPEGLNSQFSVSHGMLLQVLSREGDGCRVMRDLIADSHESDISKKRLRTRAWQLFRALLDREIVAWIPPEPSGRKLRVNVDLQTDFSLHQALSLFLIDVIGELDRESTTYALDVLTLCESIVEDPEPILRRQVDKLKTAKLEDMKVEGIEYEERMSRLDQIEHPKPMRDLLYGFFNAFAEAHPWVGEDTIRPKSIAREMLERGQSFAEYVREYGLQRIEGLLLRHLSQVWKVLAQTVPDNAKTEPVVEMELTLKELIRGIDSSLLEEWERLLHPEAVLPDPLESPPVLKAMDVTADPEAFRRLVRVTVFGFLQQVATGDWDSALALLETGQAIGDAEPDTLSSAGRDLRSAFEAFFEARRRFVLDVEGRSKKHSHWIEQDEPGRLGLAQVLIDPEAKNDWEVRFTANLPESRQAGRAIVRFVSVGPVGG
ncbi:MAG: DUF3516 domain-containing protein [Opitutaceae bacterium]